MGVSVSVSVSVNEFQGTPRRKRMHLLERTRLWSFANEVRAITLGIQPQVTGSFVCATVERIRN